MKTRVLWVPPHVRHLIPGKVYDLPEAVAKTMIEAKDAEEAPSADEVEAYNPPAGEDDAEAEAEAAPAKAAKK